MQIIILSKEKVLDYLVWINKVIQLYYINYKQNPNGDLIAMPAKHHDKPHTNLGQHPLGSKRKWINT